MKSGLSAAFFAANRQKLAQKLKGGVVAVSGYTEMQRGNDAAFDFEQEGNFWYLTGIEYPDWWLLGDGTRGKWWLVAPELSREKVIFDGGLTPEEAKKLSGVDEIIDKTEALSVLRQLRRTHAIAYVCDVPEHSDRFGFTLNPAPKEVKDLLERNFSKVQDCRAKLAELRAIKEPEELKIMQQAIDLTIQGFEKVKQKLDTYKWEYEVEADFTHHFRSNGAKGHAYSPIVAAGENACTLHYSHNHAPLKKHSLLLMDIGARVHGYAADITRTYAIGEPTKRQKEVHDAVHEAQRRIIALCTQGITIHQYIEQSNEIMAEALIALGLIYDKKDEKFYKYYPHAISHGLGIDVHDALGKPIELREGMVLTVEPGIYIPEEKIGVRIEDDILVTSDAPQNMSIKLSTSW